MRPAVWEVVQVQVVNSAHNGWKGVEGRCLRSDEGNIKIEADVCTSGYTDVDVFEKENGSWERSM